MPVAALLLVLHSQLQLHLPRKLLRLQVIRPARVLQRLQLQLSQIHHHLAHKDHGKALPSRFPPWSLCPNFARLGSKPIGAGW